MPPEQSPHLTAPEEIRRRVVRYSAYIAALYLAIAAPLFIVGPVVSLSTLGATLVLAAGLIALSAIDFETLRLPDAITLPLAVAGLLIAFALDWQPEWPWRLGAAVAGYLFIWLLGFAYEALRGHPGIGLGDAKLLAVAGAWLGPEGVPVALLYACAGALIFTIARYAAGRPLGRSEPMPFGPFIAGGIWLVWIFGPLV